MRQAGKVAVVTGAARGIGRACAERLLAEGAKGGVVAFLASDDASYITGETIYPDAGRRILNYTVEVRE